jgi:hypothetical protein
MDSTGWVVPAILVADKVKYRLFFLTLGLVGALLFGALIIYWVERWRKRTTLPGMSAGDQLTHFRNLRDKGTITQEEYERIRAQLAEDLRREMNLPQTSVTAQDVMTLPDPPPPERPRPDQ